MKIKKPKRIMSLFLAALMCVTSLVGIGTTAYAAEETDVFDGIFGGLTYAEVEFPEEKFANTFVPPTWFGRDVTEDGIYQNSALSGMDRRDIDSFVKSANKEEKR